MDEILTDVPLPGIKRITFNRPDSLNAFTFAMYDRLLSELEAVRDDPTIRVVVLTGSGKAFCAGHDLRAGGKPGWVSDDLGRAQRNRAILLRLGQIPLRMRALPQPIIVAVNGVAAGTGYSIALAGDLCIAARSAKFVNAFHNAGTGHELGISYMLPRAVGAQRAAELLLTGRRLPADEAAAMGMVLRAVDDEKLESETLALAQAVMANSPIGVSLTKQSMWMNANAGSLEAAIELENRAIFISQSTEDTAEKRKSFIEKRDPVFTGH